ncbi:hypothetical protein [Christiangramia aquimixticola]|uniref:hypothetical protein n=1 Tax=Christiangramia aquimixticola TaxID=1697558 RepID=UPI003AA85068
MDNHLYICNYCGEEYKPKKRGTQKFCKTSCRVNSHKLKKKIENIPAPQLPNPENNTGNSYEETVNAAGVINSALGNGLANGIQAVFTKNENQPATKKDIQNLLTQIQERYKPIKNMRPNPDSTMPFYDMVQKMVLYLPVKNTPNGTNCTY